VSQQTTKVHTTKLSTVYPRKALNSMPCEKSSM